MKPIHCSSPGMHWTDFLSNQCLLYSEPGMYPIVCMICRTQFRMLGHAPILLTVSSSLRIQLGRQFVLVKPHTAWPWQVGTGWEDWCCINKWRLQQHAATLHSPTLDLKTDRLKYLWKIQVLQKDRGRQWVKTHGCAMVSLIPDGASIVSLSRTLCFMLFQSIHLAKMGHTCNSRGAQPCHILYCAEPPWQLCQGHAGLWSTQPPAP